MTFKVELVAEYLAGDVSLASLAITHAINGYAASPSNHARTLDNQAAVNLPNTTCSQNSPASVKPPHPDKTPAHEKAEKAVIAINPAAHEIKLAQGRIVSNKSIIEIEEAVKKTLGTPFFGDLPDNGLKVRRNLLAASTVAIIMFFSNAQISQESTFLGLQFEGFNDLNFMSTLILLLINIYFFIHFLLYSMEAWNEWKLRLTGIKVIHTTGPGSWGGLTIETASDPRQTTLYSWWEQKQNDVEEIIESIQDRLQQAGNDKQQEISQNELSEWTQLKTSIIYIATTLERFDSSFNYAFRLQTIRWLVVVLGLPLILGLISVCILVVSLCNQW